MERETYICVSFSWFFENAHFESITKYAGFFELSRFWLCKHKPKAQFKAEKGPQTKKTIIREQKAPKFRKFIPEQRKETVRERQSI